MKEDFEFMKILNLKWPLLPMYIIRGWEAGPTGTTVAL
jgi:hypothetical protein